MRLARKLFLLTVMTVAASALAASSASAVISVSTEPGGVACSPVVLGAAHAVTGGCEITAESTEETSLYQHTGTAEVLVSRCEDDFVARIGGDGEGYIVSDVTSQHEGSVCSRAQCDEATGAMTKVPWRIHVREGSPGNEYLRVSFCLRAFPGPETPNGIPCTLEIPMSSQSPTHRYEFETAQEQPCIGLPQIEVSGHWSTEPVNGNSGIEITHPVG